MSMRAQLTREVRRSPEDALSPLVLADYLEREGDKRADYLRWSHTAARSEHEDERAQGRDNLRSLLEAHEPEWSMPLPGKANWWCWSVTGIDALEMPASAKLEPETVFAQHPVHDLALSDLQGGLPPDWQGWTGELSAFRLRSGAIGDMGLSRIIAAGEWPWLQRLELRASGAGPSATLELSKRGILDKLRSLDLSWSPAWGDRSLAHLCEHGAPEMVALNIGHSNITAQGIAPLLAGDPFPRLEHLALATTSATWRFATSGLAAMSAALSTSPILPRLVSLDLSGWKLGPDAWSDLASSGLASNLTELALARCSLGTDGTAILREGHALSGVRRINVSFNGLAPFAVRLLANSPMAQSLEELDLAGNQFLDKGLYELLDSPLIDRPVRLGLRANGIGEQGVKALANLPTGRILGLGLGENPVPGAALAKLLASPALSEIRYLDIAHLPAELPLVDALAKAETPASLEALRIDSNLLRAFLARKRLWIPPSARWLVEGTPDRDLLAALFKLGAHEVLFETDAPLLRRFRKSGALPAA